MDKLKLLRNLNQYQKFLGEKMTNLATKNYPNLIWPEAIYHS